MTKIAITDDHPLLLEGLKNILSKEDYLEVVGGYADAASMMSGLQQHPAEILLLDINLPDANSMELLEQLLLLFPEMPIIMLSVHNEYAVINGVMQEGASGYIQKNASAEEIIAGIEQVLEGKKFLCAQSRKVIEQKDLDGLKRVPKLTRREKEILAEAATGLTTIQIAEKLFISPHTVESHRKNVIEKFKASNLSSAIKLAIEYGLIRHHN
ncbi:response regulator transcription factor [Sphingobacterium bambusae]|uniref:Response regulator n=1 Tax=Sphingobacterium bambusae TaxID=662858 RepID=A0ABW6BBY3_9SPHI|nr:response regulator transcription factor [Sphingobacterium bambusae]WPL48282.1 response regulator transcription factor [Sphingobacterium bambusae]